MTETTFYSRTGRKPKYQKCEDLENITKNSNKRMYEAIKRINKLSSQSPLLVQSKNGTLYSTSDFNAIERYKINTKEKLL